MAGWIKLYRKIIDWEWYTDANTARLFFHLLLIVSHTEVNYRGILLKPGQVCTGRIQLARDLDLTEQQIRTAMNKLIRTGEIEKETPPGRQFSIITLKNWEEYQPRNNLETTDNQPTFNQPPTNLQPAFNHNQECNNANNVENDRSNKTNGEQGKYADAREVEAEEGLISSIDRELLFSHFGNCDKETVDLYLELLSKFDYSKIIVAMALLEEGATIDDLKNKLEGA